MTRFYFDLSGNPIEKPPTFRSFKGVDRTRSVSVPLDGGTPVTRDEYESLVRRLDVLEALLKGATPVTQAVTDSVTQDDNVTPDRNANAERQRRYRERKKAGS